MQCCGETDRIMAGRSASFPLALASEGEKVRIVFFRENGVTLRKRLLGMGICQDDEIVIVAKHDGGAVLIARGGSRIALGGGMANKINVTRC